MDMQNNFRSFYATIDMIRLLKKLGMSFFFAGSEIRDYAGRMGK